MRNVFRRSVAGALTAATIAFPVVTATPAAAQTYDCRFMGVSYLVQDAVECVYFILITAIDDPDLPPHI